MIAANYNPGAMWAYDTLQQWLSEHDIGFTLGRYDSDAELIAAARDADIFLAYKYRVSRAIIESLPRLKLLMSSGSGYDHIDVSAATDNGVLVTNAPLHNVEDVAEHTLALVLACARKLIRIERAVHGGGWRPDVQPVNRLSGKTVGLIGFGNIARAVNWRLQGIGMRVLVHSRSATADDISAAGATRADMDTLLRQSDFVSLHWISTSSTRNALGHAEFAKMKPGAFVINTSRGDLIDAPALVEALRSGRIAGAGLDVLAQEPPDPNHPLLHMDNVIVSGHSAASTVEASQAWVQEWIGILGDYANGIMPATVVNPDVRPRASLKPRPGARP